MDEKHCLVHILMAGKAHLLDLFVSRKFQKTEKFFCVKLISEKFINSTEISKIPLTMQCFRKNSVKSTYLVPI